MRSRLIAALVALGIADLRAMADERPGRERPPVESGWFTLDGLHFPFDEYLQVGRTEPPEVFLCTMPDLQEPNASQPSSDSHSTPASREAAAEGGTADLAKKLSNPVADLISVPFQNNFDFGGGVDIPDRRRGPLRNLLALGRPALRAARTVARLADGGPDRDQAFRYTLNFQPVIPISIAPEWNVISRTILPVTYNDDVFGATSQGGLGDLTQSFFFSPKNSKPIWGVGPVFYVPTATDDSLGAERWGMGPTGVVLLQEGPWTFGALANHIWSFARDDGRKEINATFLQPFIAYNFKTATTITFNTESTYDWIDNQWTVPLFLGVAQIVKIGKLPVQFQLGGRYWVEGPDTAPDWGVRFNVVLLLPK